MRGVLELSGLGAIRTMHSAGKRSIPKVQSSSYIDLYMLSKEKERLEKECYVFEKRRSGIEKRLKDISTEMERLQGEEKKVKKAESNINIETPEKKWKKMALSY